MVIRSLKGGDYKYCKANVNLCNDININDIIKIAKEYATKIDLVESDVLRKKTIKEAAKSTLDSSNEINNILDSEESLTHNY